MSISISMSISVSVSITITIIRNTEYIVIVDLVPYEIYISHLNINLTSHI